ncbi:MAG TPA: hypothetical protein VJ246_00910 [Patescibacteria group bacterium]|nr:hypothetical protein [Patescibacteria group bacterium]
MSKSTTTQAPKYLDDAFQEECATLLKTFLKKHKDYGKGNILEIGELGISFRIAEKVSRLKNLLAKSEGPKNESIEDTWIDIGVYAVIAQLYRKGLFQKLEVK